MKITFLKSFKFCGVKYATGQTSPSKRFPDVPFDDRQISVLVSMGYIQVDIPAKAKEATTKETKAKK